MEIEMMNYDDVLTDLFDDEDARQKILRDAEAMDLYSTPESVPDDLLDAF
jgi:hypothetical protein